MEEIMKEKKKLLKSQVVIIMLVLITFVLTNYYCLISGKTIYEAVAIAATVAATIAIIILSSVSCVEDDNTLTIIAAFGASLAVFVAAIVALFVAVVSLGAASVSDCISDCIAVTSGLICGLVMFTILTMFSSCSDQFIKLDNLKMPKKKLINYISIEIMFIWGIMMGKVFLF